MGNPVKQKLTCQVCKIEHEIEKGQIIMDDETKKMVTREGMRMRAWFLCQVMSHLFHLHLHACSCTYSC